MSNHWTPRAAAARAVAEVLFHHRSLTTALPKATESLDPGDHALTQEITYGVLRHSFQLEAIAKKLLKRPFKKKNGDLHGLVLGGLYQLQWMRVPPHAALSETVNATAVLKKEWARGVINAVLRRFQREQEALLEATNQQPSLRFNHPQWIIQKLQQGWPEHWERTLHANNQRPPMSLRVNLQQQSRDHYLEALCSSGIEIAPPTEPPVNIPTL
ncbi:MAG: 16S rRNA (cytosine(967)-C(5))-methyltransferase, partial [Gammaproteobacteria bacterium]|nr:16S rRNA (cytosine(967)-C(5))-methyltransferase [Gammaproteobacteria bacterium]